MGTGRSTFQKILLILFFVVLVAGCRHQGSRDRAIDSEDNGGGGSEEVMDKPVIKTHPSSLTVPVGNTAVFLVAAQDPAGVTYQWQQSADGEAWTDVPGATGDSYQVIASTHAWFRCVLTNTGGSAISNGAELTVVKVRFVKQDAAGRNDGTSWTDAYTDLQHALTAVPAGEKLEVWVAAGTYRPTSGSSREASFAMMNDLDIYGGFAGNETFREARDWENQVTILSGDINVQDEKSDNSYCVVKGADNAALDGFTITGAYSINIGNCGGMVNSSSSPTVINCIFTGNESRQGGGMNNSSSSPIVTNCIFTGNKAVSGGGMYNYNNSNATVKGCTFFGNTASGRGGGINSEYCSNPAITNCILWGNTAGCRGAQLNGVPAVSFCCVQGGAAGTGNIDADPLLGIDLTLQPGSPCINAGSDEAAAGILSDLAGSPRISGAHVDMGAYEYQE